MKPIRLFRRSGGARGGASGDPRAAHLFFSLQISCPAKRGDVFDKRDGLGVDMAKVLHGEQGFTYHRRSMRGDRITVTTTTEDIYARKGGALEFVVQTTRFEKGGVLSAESRQVPGVRNG